MEYRNNGNQKQSPQDERERIYRDGLPVYKINEVVGHEVEVLGYEAREGTYGRYLWIKLKDRSSGEKCWLVTGAKAPCRKVVSALTNKEKSRVGRVVYKDPYYDLEGMD